MAPMTKMLVTAACGVLKSTELPTAPLKSTESLETVVRPGALRLEKRFHTDSKTALHSINGLEPMMVEP